MKFIESKKNPMIRLIESLKDRKNRERESLFILEGLNMIKDSVSNGYKLKTIVFSDGFLNRFYEEFLYIKNKTDADLVRVTDDVFREVSDTQSPQGILALGVINNIQFQDIHLKEGGFYLLLDEIQDPGNLGTIIRTADAFGVDGIFLSKGTVDPYNPKVVRGTMGSIFRVPLYFIDLFEDFADLINGSFSLYSTDVNGEDIRAVDFENTIVVLGNESRGVSEEVLEYSDKRLRIPMVGEVESLNVAVASSIFMYESMKRKLR